MQIALRKATLADAQLIAHLTRSCWAEKVAATSSGHHEDSERVTRDLIQGGGFVLSVDKEPAGSVRWLPLDAGSNVWEMLRMGVLPAFRGHALSQYLLEAVVHAAQAAHVAELRLGVRRDQPRLLALYAAHRFEIAPELGYSHANPNEPAPNVMRRYLRN
ncbi:GNAT family N-acetyltransferase [Undibacterium sp. Jales W-56]|uniref:GNAT family N-acetyltransferase n=1 Tax=Undibacterium sp. Jales W-56 TaxID=2897325 RepID=UPI0021CF5A13|nr:GNAT family N-acetyltransferase [Undibacterium sp. Jales W-56]MCU6432891.1 GNAT family N-acetyltransferase [Undibacterium sp. Jales W-56]